MSTDLRSIEQLTARIGIDTELARELVAEIAAHVTKDYLTIEELARRLSWKKRTVENKMEAGIFVEGVHYFARKGIRVRLKWSAIVAWLEQKESRTYDDAPVDAVPMARGYLLGHRRKQNSTP